MLAPQRGLFTTVESNSNSHVIQMARAMLTVMWKGVLPELSNFYCHPGKAGGSPFCNSRGNRRKTVREEYALPDGRRTRGTVRASMGRMRQLLDNGGLRVLVFRVFHSPFKSGSGAWTLRR